MKNQIFKKEVKVICEATELKSSGTEIWTQAVELQAHALNHHGYCFSVRPCGFIFILIRNCLYQGFYFQLLLIHVFKIHTQNNTLISVKQNQIWLICSAVTVLSLVWVV